MIFKNQFLNFRQDFLMIFFVLAFLLYALWGSPTPNNPDWVELAIGLFLVLSVGLLSIIKNFLIVSDQRQDHWQIILKVFFLFGIVVPVLIGVMSGNDVIILVRDIIAFIFLCLPLFLLNYVRQTDLRCNIFFILCLIIGLVFSIRVLVPHFLLFRNTTELLYLANSPLVLMTALFFMGHAFYKIYQKASFHQFIQMVIFLALASLPIMAMFVDLQRASFAALLLSAITQALIGFAKAPLKTILPFLLCALMTIFFYDYFSQLSQNVGEKTAQVGLNMRLQELQAVWETLFQHPLSILFGMGWGAEFSSPAVGNLNVSYTHSLLSYIFFKMGLVGLCLSLVYLYFVFEKWVRLYFSDVVKGNAVIWPFIIPIFLYASHKSFDFGILLTLILVSAYRIEKGQA